MTTIVSNKAMSNMRYFLIPSPGFPKILLYSHNDCIITIISHDYLLKISKIRFFSLDLDEKQTEIHAEGFSFFFLFRSVVIFYITTQYIHTMSIATLKRKTENLYKVQNEGKHFSINGTRRSQGWVGQTSLSRSLSRPAGNNGLTPELMNLNDPSVVKSSVVGTNGMLNMHYRWINRPQPYSSVKSDNNLNNGISSDHTANITNCAIKNVDTSNKNIIKTTKPVCSFANSKHLNATYNNINTNSSLCAVTKPNDTSSNSSHLESVKSPCVNLNNHQLSYRRDPLPGN